MSDLVGGVLAQYGCGPELEAPEADGPFNAVAERHRQALIAKLEQAKASTEILIALVTNHGSDADAFEAQARALGTILSEAGGDAARFHFSRECKGVC